MTTLLDSLTAGLHAAMQQDARVYLIGEDLLDPYGGAFKVARGLSSAFPERVWSTPISEGGFVGIATGMALRGLRPVVEIMFGDFLTLAADQVINHAAKFGWMFGGATDGAPVGVPLLIRTPMGGRRGYGPTHSQTLEKHFLGTPGLQVLAPTTLGDPSNLLRRAILESNQPTLFVENKLQYLLPILDAAALAEFDLRMLPGGESAGDYAPSYALRIAGAPPPVLTLTAYGYMSELARQAMLRLAYEDEIFAELIVPTRLAPFDLSAVLASAHATQRLVTIEEGGLSLGWGAEVLAQAAVQIGPRLLSARRVAALDLPVPASGPLEAQVLPGIETIIAACRALAVPRT